MRVSEYSNVNQYQQNPYRQQALTEDQKTAITSILEEYDSENLTDEDKQGIMNAFKDAGIRPSKEVRTLVEDAGFDLSPPEGAQMAGSVGGMQGPPPVPPPGPPPGGETQGVDALQEETSESYLQLIMQYQNGDIDQNTFTSLIDNLIESAKNNGASLFSMKG